MAIQTEPRPTTVTLPITGMTCASCVRRIEKALSRVNGVNEASVNLATEQATVMYDSSQTGLEPMMQKVEAVGYKATPLVSPPLKPVLQEMNGDLCATLTLDGMTCASCAMRIEKGLKKVPGVQDASVNFATEQATVTMIRYRHL